MTVQKPTTATERAPNNRYLLDRIRRQLIQRQPGNEVFKSIVENLSNENLFKHWLKHENQRTRKPGKASPIVLKVR